MTIDPELLPFIERNRAAWPVPGHHFPLAEWRAKYEAQIAAARGPRPAGVAVHDCVVADSIPVRIYRSAVQDPPGTLVYFHGGGWVLGSLESHDDITADIAHDTGCAVVSVDYSRAPEHPFPKAFEEACAVVDWVAAGGMQPYGVSATAVVVAGDSAGGNLAAACAVAAAQSALRLSGQILLYPCLDVNFERPSYLGNRDAPFLDSEQMIWFWQQYASSLQARLDPRAVPLRTSDEQLKRVAPAFVAIAEHDPLHDEGFEYGRRLAEAGCAVTLQPGTGLVHGYIRLRAAANEPRRIYRAMCDWARERLEADSVAL